MNKKISSIIYVLHVDIIHAEQFKITTWVQHQFSATGVPSASRWIEPFELDGTGLLDLDEVADADDTLGVNIFAFPLFSEA